MNKQEFLEKAGRRYHEFACPHFGTVRIRNLSAADMQAIIAEETAAGDDDPLGNERYIVRSVVDADGNLVFDPTDAQAIKDSELDWAVITTISREVLSFNGLKKTTEEAVKN